ncbi:MAG: adenylyltransferase/cytidyltransferase family protein, partial [Armatimonadetes bacterium]|nr:adenylyltransferase/cytidyltransferase family protein [Armatimonadota bacterium]
MERSGQNLSQRKRLGLMGGTFDPIHVGHLVVAEEARTRFDLERVIFVPNNQPPHKKAYQVAQAEH